MMEELGSYETWVLTRATRRNIPEYDILHSHRCENLTEDDILHSHHRENFTYFLALTGWAL
jgi:hypothetical protein